LDKCSRGSILALVDPGATLLLFEIRVESGSHCAHWVRLLTEVNLCPGDFFDYEGQEQSPRGPASAARHGNDCFCPAWPVKEYKKFFIACLQSIK